MQYSILNLKKESRSIHRYFSTMEKTFRLALVLAVILFDCSYLAVGQTPESGLPPGVPRLVKFSGVLKDASGYLLNGTEAVTFAVYTDSAGGSPLWEEAQNVQFYQGRYTVFLGQSRSTGIPAEIFSSGQPRWLGVRILVTGEEEQPRTFLTSVPYALKAVDADTVGGLPASAFLKANPDGSGVLATAPVDALAPAMQDVQSASSLTVTTPGGTTGTVPEFSANSVIGNSPIKVSHGVVGMQNLENVRFADQFPCPSSAGCGGKSDFGAQVNAAYASCPANGCRIRIPAGSYTVSTPISFTTPQKTVKLECDAGTSNNILYPDQGTTELHYTETSGAAITMTTGGGTGSGIEGCTLVGPGVGGANKAIGLQLVSASKQTYKDLFISGFNVGLQFGDWVYLDNFYNLQLENNATNLYAPPSITIGTGESVGFFGGVFTNKSTTSFSTTCVDIEGGQAIVMSFYNVSFDQCGVTVNIPGGQQFLFSGSHFEDPSAATNSDFLTIGSNCISCQVILSGSDIFETHPSSRTEFISLGGGARLTIVGGIYLAAEPIPQIISSTNLANAVTVLGAEKLNQIGVWVSGTYAAFTIIDPREYHPLTVAGGPIILGGNPSINGSLVSAPLSQSRTWTFPDASGTVLLSGSSGANAQSRRVSGCGTVARAGATCTSTIAWSNAFADTNYTVSCTGEGIVSGVPLGGGLITKTKASVVFQTVTATTEAAQYANIDCIALHE
jgi:hypothetical protein